ncbi:hypothetical protein ACOMHN_044230 [Nucella lapillus]
MFNCFCEYDNVISQISLTFAISQHVLYRVQSSSLRGTAGRRYREQGAPIHRSWEWETPATSLETGTTPELLKLCALRNRRPCVLC